MAKKISQPANRNGDNLEPYRQLIEIQRQLVKLSRQHEKTKRECAELREKLAHEVMASRGGRTKLQHRLRHTAGKWLQRLPLLSPSTPPVPAQPSSC